MEIAQVKRLSNPRVGDVDASNKTPAVTDSLDAANLLDDAIETLCVVSHTERLSAEMAAENCTPCGV